jgi:hypothetical protein
VFFIVLETGVVGSIKGMRKGKYQEDFIKTGFISTVINGKEGPQCVICCEELENVLR